MKICERTLTAFRDINNSELKTMPFVCMKNLDIDAFGIITRYSIQEDVPFEIINRETDEKYIFQTPEEVVEAGWMVD
jgi:hypothetical protein